MADSDESRRASGPAGPTLDTAVLSREYHSRVSTSVEQTIARRFRSALDRLGVPAGATVVVGCSGGADSVALADLAMAAARGGRLGPVTLLYVDHGLRNEVAAEAASVEALAGAGGGRARVERAEVDLRTASLEAAAREARYGVFERVAEDSGADCVLLAHTATDQAETVLMRALRGSGVAGLAGIPAVRGRYVRPLLEVSRADLEAYLVARGLRWVTDPMNRDPRFTRNRVRHELMPLLARENPAVEAALCRLAAAAREQRDVLDFAASALLGAARRAPGLLAVAALAAAPPAVAKRAISLAIDEVTVPTRRRQVGARHLAAVREMVARRGAGSWSLDLPGLRVTREYDTLRLERADAAADAPPPLAVEGPEGPYRIRPWAAGDRMRPARLRGRSRKLSRLYVDAKVPRRLRQTARVVVRAADGAILWAEHLGPAHGSRIHVTLTTPTAVASNKC